MIASWRGLAILAALAVALGTLLLALPPPRTKSAESRLIAPDFRGRLTDLGITRGSEHLTLRLEAKGELGRAPRLLGTSPRFVADTDTINALVSALRNAQWHRVARAAAAGALRGSTTVRTDERVTLTFSIGQELPGAAQTWIVRDDRALLVDTWVVNAVWPDPLRLRERFPFAEATSPDQEIRIGELHIAGGRRKLTGAVAVWLDADRVRELVDALVSLELVSLEGMTRTAKGPAITISIVMGDFTTATLAGTCTGGRVVLELSTGDGCFEAKAWQRVLDAAAALTKPVEEVAELRPAPITPAKIKYADGTILDLQGRPRIGAEDADPARVEELLAALSTPATLVFGSISKARSKLIVIDSKNQWLTLLLSDTAIAREGEPFALRPEPAAWKVITRPASALRDPVLWREDPITLTSLTIDGVTYTRGAVLGEWTRTPAGTVDTALVDAVVSSLASVRAPIAPPPATIAHRLAVTFTPPAGAPTTHTLELGPPAADGCVARVDRGAPVRLDLPLCTAAIALASAR